MIEMYKQEDRIWQAIYVGTSVLDLSKLCMMDFHYNTIHNNFEGKYNLLYSDTDSLVYSIQHDDIYAWIKQSKQHFDLSDSIRPDLKDNTNNKVLGKCKDEHEHSTHDGILGTEPEGIFHQPPDDQRVQRGENQEQETLKGVSKVVVNKEIKHDDYVNVIDDERGSQKGSRVDQKLQPPTLHFQATDK